MCTHINYIKLYIAYNNNNTVIFAEVVVKFRDKIRGLEGEMKSILKQEEEEKELRVSEMQVNKARNMIEHEQEIFSRPARTWIQASNQKSATSEGNKAAKKEKKKKKPETVRINLSYLCTVYIATSIMYNIIIATSICIIL